MTSTSALIDRPDPTATLASMELTVPTLPVTGALPKELDGRHLQINPTPPGTSSAGRRWFTGEGMVHGIRLVDGQARWYRSRWVRSDRVCRALGELPIPGSRHGLSDAANMNVVAHHGKILALGEAGVLPVRLDGELASLSTVDFDGTLPNGFSSHPQRDPVTGELFAIAYYHELAHAQYLIVDPGGRVRHSVPIPVSGTPLLHSLSLTDRHAIIYDLPVAFDPALAALGSRCPYSWQPDRPARLGVLPREDHGRRIRWFEVDPCYVFHPLGAYERGDEITLDVIRHDRVFHRDPVFSAETPPRLWRWRVDLAAGTVRAEQLGDVPEEFPRIDERRTTMPYRYGYTVAMRCGDAGPCGNSALYRHDLVRGTVLAHDFGPGARPGEAVFVPRGPRSAEDDGWLLSLVTDSATERTDLVVLAADDFAGPEVARVHLPVGLPDCGHANWIPSC